MAWATAERYNRVTGERTPLVLHPDTTESIAHRFATVARFVPGARVELSAIDEEIMRAALGPIQPGKALSFEDQYISTGGQLYGLIAGHDAFVADLRPMIEPLLAREGRAFGLACHPYDLAAALIAEEAGVLLSDGRGNPLDAPLDTRSDVAGSATPTRIFAHRWSQGCWPRSPVVGCFDRSLRLVRLLCARTFAGGGPLGARL